MISLFEQEIAQTDRLCIDATQGGARITGTRIMSLKQALRAYATRETRDPSPLIRKKWITHRMPRAENIYKGLDWIYREADQVQQLCDNALSLLDPLVKNKKPDDLKNCQHEIDRINAIANRMVRHQAYKEVVKDRLVRVLVAQFKLKYLSERTQDENERLWMDIKQSHLFFTQIGRVSRQIIQGAVPIKDRFESMLASATEAADNK